MQTWRTLAALLVSLTVARTGWAQSHTLTEPSQAGDCLRIQLDLAVSGDIKISKDGKTAMLKQEARAAHTFAERVLSVSSTGLPDKVARFYEKARSTISINGDSSDQQLRPDRRLLVAQRYKEQALVYSPAGTLTRDELELSDHFDTLSVTGLLPGRAVAIGETWKVANSVAQALCNFDGLTEQGLTCKLEEVKDQIARVGIAGTATGIDLGALVKLSIEGNYQFDLTAKRLIRLEWKQKEERDQGPASPAMIMQSATKMTRAALEQPASLSDVSLVSVPDGFEPTLLLTQLEHRDPKAGYTMTYVRDWQTVSQSNEHVVMRLIDRGDFVAQLTLTPWTRAEKGKHLSPDEFKQAMSETPGWEQEQELQAGEVPAEGGRWIYRLSALGQLDGAKVLHNSYLVAGPGGEQLVLVFTLTPKQVERLGTRDLSLVGSIEFSASGKDGDKGKKP